jgi:hypothetical protein
MVETVCMQPDTRNCYWGKCGKATQSGLPQGHSAIKQSGINLTGPRAHYILAYSQAGAKGYRIQSSGKA